MAEEIKSALDAVNAALAGEDIGDPTGVVEDTSEDDTEGLDPTVESSDGSDADGDAGDAEGTDSGDEEPPAESADLAAEAAALGVSTKRENGQFKSKDELAADIAAKKSGVVSSSDPTKSGKPVAGKDAKAGKKEPDPVNDPIPTGLKKETETRMRTLIDRTKQSEEKAAVAESNFNTIVQGLQATGTTPEQYSEVLSFMQLFNSGDPKQQEQALGLLEDMTDRLATALGRERTLPDPLAAHPDLMGAIQRGEITKKYAAEVARTRNQGAFKNQIQNATTEQARVAEAAQREVDESKAALNTRESQLRATDPNYDKKREIMLPYLTSAFKHARPSAWLGLYNDIYQNTKVGPAPVVRKVPTNQPLRARGVPVGSGGGNGDMKTQAGSALDAVNAALAGMGK
jgi:hypothetical protein